MAFYFSIFIYFLAASVFLVPVTTVSFSRLYRPPVDVSSRLVTSVDASCMTPPSAEKLPKGRVGKKKLRQILKMYTCAAWNWKESVPTWQQRYTFYLIRPEILQQGRNGGIKLHCHAIFCQNYSTFGLRTRILWRKLSETEL